MADLTLDEALSGVRPMKAFTQANVLTTRRRWQGDTGRGAWVLGGVRSQTCNIFVYLDVSTLCSRRRR
jgi:hypothetical protein